MDESRYKVIIAEDELLVRKGLIRSIDWAAYGMEIVAEAVNGQQALDLYHEKKPDLIITDLQMPVMGGLALIEKIREKDRNTVIVILSCHDEFELIRRAISLSVSDYIFKLTMTEEETDGVLKKARGELDKRSRSVEAALFPPADRDYYKEKLIKDYLFHREYSEEEFKGKVREYRLNLGDESFMLCLMEIDPSVLNRGKREKNHALMLTIVDKIGSLLREGGEVIYDRENRYIILLDNSRGLDRDAFYRSAAGLAGEIVKAVSEICRASVSLGASEIRSGYSSLEGMLAQAQKMLAHAFVQGTGTYFARDEWHTERAYDGKISELSAFFESHRLLFDNSYEDRPVIVDELRETDYRDRKAILNRFDQLFQWTATFFDVENRDTRDWIIDGTEAIRHCPTLGEIIDSYVTAVFEIAEASSKERILGDSISLATQFIQKNYTEYLSLPVVADYLAISPAYLSNLFKKKLGVNFVDYLNELRVGKARELLKGTSLKTYEIAEKVGFSDTTYFSKTFKKYAGLSPSSYRKRWEQDALGRDDSRGAD